MILLAMMFILSSRCEAAARALRGPAPGALSRGAVIRKEDNSPSQMHFRVYRNVQYLIAVGSELNQYHVLIDEWGRILKLHVQYS